MLSGQDSMNLGVALTNPAIVNDNRKFSATSKEYRSLEKIVKSYDQYSNLLDDLAFNREALNGDDDELRELAKMETSAWKRKRLIWKPEIRQLLIPKDPQDEKNAIIEIRAGTGGDEASLFAGDLFSMYMKYCEKRGLRTALA